MKTPYRNAAVFAVVLLTALQAAAQLPRDPEERAKAIAQIMQTNSRQLTLFDREGKELTAVGTRDLYQQPVFAPDAKRLAVIKVDLEKESNDLWVVDVATGKTTRISTSGERESAASPAWAPDGSRVAYVGLRQGAYGLYQKPSNGEGTEELLYKSNAPLVLTDWSQDGRYLTFYSTDLGGGAHICAAPRGQRRAQANRDFPQQISTDWTSTLAGRSVCRLRLERNRKNRAVRQAIQSKRSYRTRNIGRSVEAFRAGRSRHGVLETRRQGNFVPCAGPQHPVRFAEHLA